MRKVFFNPIVACAEVAILLIPLWGGICTIIWITIKMAWLIRMDKNCSTWEICRVTWKIGWRLAPMMIATMGIFLVVATNFNLSPDMERWALTSFFGLGLVLWDIIFFKKLANERQAKMKNETQINE